MNVLRNWRACLAALAISLVGAAATAQPAPEKTFVMKIATATSNEVQHEWMRRFAATIERRVGGRIKVELYPASQAGIDSAHDRGDSTWVHSDVSGAA